MNDNDLPDYIDELDRLLMDQGDDCLLLTQLDGFLAGIIVSPDLVPSSQWLRQIWIGEDGQGMPVFPDLAGFQRMLDLVMQHYNATLAALDDPGHYEPLFDVDTRNDDVLWELWIAGFCHAMVMAPAGWRRITAGKDSTCKAALVGIAKLKAIADGTLRLSASKEAQWTREAPDLIPLWVEALHRWRLENDPNRPGHPDAASGKVGRNEPCPCGSGKKYKKCCGLN